MKSPFPTNPIPLRAFVLRFISPDRFDRLLPS